MKKFKFVAKTAIGLLVAVVMATAAMASDLKDIDGHWSEQYVKYGVEKGYINGYLDSTFKPDSPVTRAEFAKMLNSALGISKKAAISFSDVSGELWYYPEVQKAIYAGYVTGYEDGNFRATNLITRQEAAVILSRIATRPEAVKEIDTFKDYTDVSSWAKDAFKFAYSKGFFTGDDLGNLIPLSTLTRAQAAKLLYTLITNENVHTGNYSIDLGQALCSETIFTDDVVFQTESEKPSITLDGCRVFGSLLVNTDNDVQISLHDTSLGHMENKGSFAKINLTDGAKIKYLSLESPAHLSGEGYGTVFLNGKGLMSDTTQIDANPELVIVSSDAVIKTENLPSLQINGTSSLTIQSGTIENLEITSAGRNSVITIASGAKIEKLTVNAPVSFMGSGEISNANVKVDGVSFATTLDIEKKTGVDADTEDEDNKVGEDEFAPSSISPRSGATNVSRSPTIRFTFDSSLYHGSGNSITLANIYDSVELRKGSATGTKLNFEAELVSSKIFEISPENDLLDETKYYVILKAGAFKNSSGETNPKLSYYFTTKASDEQEVEGKITFTPANGAKEIELDDALKITFPSAIRRNDGKNATEAYLSNTAIELREKSVSGECVDISVTVNSTSKILTITPEQILKPDTKYYLIVVGGTLEYSNAQNIPKTYSSFTTANDLQMVSNPKYAATGVSVDTEIVLEFNTEIYRSSGSNVTSVYLCDEVIELRRSTTSGTKVDFSAVMSSDKKTVKIIPDDELSAGTRYYVNVVAGSLANDDGEENKKLSTYFTTAAVMAPSITPENKQEDVVPESSIVIKFSEPLYQYVDKQKPITPEYVAEKVVVLRKNNASGTKLDFDVQISSDYKTITIVPVKAFSSNSTYYVSVTKNTLRNQDGKANTSANSTFTTAASNKPDFLPYNGEVDVEPDSQIAITFESPMYQIGGAALTTTYVKNSVLRLYKDNLDGEEVAFTVKLSTDKQTMAIIPSKELEGNTTYIAIIRKASLEDASGNENPFYSSSFTTIEAVDTDFEITPETNTKDVPTDVEITVNFESPVYRTDGIVASGAYIANNALELRKGSANGTKIDCTAQISSDNKTITLIPEKELDKNTKYYVKLVSGKLEYSNGKAVATKTAYFTTTDGTPVISLLEVTDTSATSVELKIEVSKDATAYITATATGAEKVQATAQASADDTNIVTVNGLDSNKSYTISVYLMDDDAAKSTTKTITAKTQKPVSVEMEKDDEKNTIDVKVTAYGAGTLEIKYKATNQSNQITVVSGKNVKANSNDTLTIDGLEGGKTYTVNVKFEDESGTISEFTDSFTFETDVVEMKKVTEIQVEDDAGDGYTATIAQGVCEITMQHTDTIKLCAKPFRDISEITYANVSADAGEFTEQIPVNAGQNVISIKVIYTDLSEETITLTVNVNE